MLLPLIPPNAAEIDPRAIVRTSMETIEGGVSDDIRAGGVGLGHHRRDYRQVI